MTARARSDRAPRGLGASERTAPAAGGSEPRRHPTPDPDPAPPGLARLRPRIKVWMECPDGVGFGSRFVEILEAVDRNGSIKHAAAELGWSYRHVWSRIKKVEAALGDSLVIARRGGQGTDRSELTPTGRSLVSQFHALRARVLEVAAHQAGVPKP